MRGEKAIYCISRAQSGLEGGASPLYPRSITLYTKITKQQKDGVYFFKQQQKDPASGDSLSRLCPHHPSLKKSWLRACCISCILNFIDSMFSAITFLFSVVRYVQHLKSFLLQALTTKSVILNAILRSKLSACQVIYAFEKLLSSL